MNKNKAVVCCLTLSLLLGCVFNSFGQAWTRIHSLPASFCNNIIRLQDGGFLVCGETEAYGPPGSNAMIVKTDSMGYWQWQVALGGVVNEYGFRATQNAGGDIFVVSSPFLFSGTPDGSLITRLSANGKIIWTHSFNGPQPRFAYGITASGYDVVITGKINNTSLGTGEDLFIMKMDTSANTVWNKIYGGPHRQIGNCISNLSDGGYLVGAGVTSPTDSTSLMCYAMRTDANGDTLWTRYGTVSYNGNGGGLGFYGCTQLKGDSLVTFSGGIRTFYSNAIATTYRMDGTLKYNYISTSLADWAYDLTATYDGGFIMAGLNGVSEGNGKLFKFSHTGNSPLVKHYFGFGSSSFVTFSNFHHAFALPDGSCIAVGYSSLFGNNSPPSYGRMLIMKTNPVLDANYDINGVITATDTTTFCKGDSVTLNATPGFAHYQWFWMKSSSSVSNVLNSDAPTLTVDSSGNYRCIMWDDNHVSYSNFLAIQAADAPDTIIYSTGPLLHCASMDTIKINVKPQPGTTFQWYLNGTAIPNITNQVVPLISGQYSIRVANPCDTLLAVGVYVDVNVAQQLTLDTGTVLLPFFKGASASCSYHTFNVATLPGTTYSWYRNGIPIGGITATDSVNLNGNYYLTAQNVCGTSFSNVAHVVYDTLKLTIDTINVTPCDNRNLYLRANHSSTDYYEWYKNGTLVSSGNGVSTLTPGSPNGLDTGYYYCRVTQYCNGNTITGTTDSVYYAERHVDNYINAVGTIPTCNGAPVFLQAMGNIAQYQWYKDSVLISGATGQSYTATSTGMYMLDITLPCGTMQYSYYLNFGPPDTSYWKINYLNDNDTTICITSSGANGVQLVANGLYSGNPFTIQWQYFNADIQGATGGYYSTSVPGQYRCALTNSCGTSYTTPLNVTAVSLPDFQVTPGPIVTTCLGGNIVLSLPYDSSYTYEWYNILGTIPGSDTNNIIASPNFSYYGAKISKSTCFKYATSTSVRLQPLSLNNILPFTPPFICDDSVKLSANERYDYTYQWYENSNLITGATQQYYYATHGGDYSVRIFDSLTCFSDAPILTVVDSLIGTINISSNLASPACIGDSVVLSTVTGYASYQWYVNGNSINGANTASIHAPSSGNYSVQVTNLSGCSGGASYNLLIYKPPLILQQNVVPAQCATSTGSIAFVFDTNYVYIDLTRPDGNTFTYNGYAGNTYTINGLVSGWYHYTYHYSNLGCPKSDSVFVPQVNTFNPHILISDTTACVGQVIYLYPSFYSNVFMWSTGSTASSIYVNSSGMYTLTVTDTIGGCTGVDSVYVTIAPLPQVNISPSGPVSLCPGNSIVLDAGNGNYTYLWSTGQQSQTINTTTSGLYIVTVTDVLTTCVARDTVHLSIFPSPAISITPHDTGYFCHGQSIALHATPGFASYLWTGGITDSVWVVNTAGTYAVNVTDTNGCTAADSVVLLSNPAPAVTINNVDPSCAVCCDGIATAIPSGGTPPFIFLWGNGSTLQSINSLCNGTYTVTITDANGCMDSVTISNSVGLTVANIISDLSVFPNPTRDALYVKGKCKANTDVQISLRDLCGRNVLQNKLITVVDGFNIKLNLDHLSPSLYFLTVTLNEKSITLKVEKSE